MVDDLLGLAVIAFFYSSHVRWIPLLIGALLLSGYGADGYTSSSGGGNTTLTLTDNTTITLVGVTTVNQGQIVSS